MKRSPWLVGAAILLAGCAPSPGETPAVVAQATRTAVPSGTAPVPTPPSVTSQPAAATRVDEQGAVIFEVTPINLGSPGDTLDFEVVMNTHSVDLGWDLAPQSVLLTDSGIEVRGIRWPVGSGHHYGGTLTFPARTAAGDPILGGAATLTLVIRDTDVPERVFTWQLAP